MKKQIAILISLLLVLLSGCVGSVQNVVSSGAVSVLEESSDETSTETTSVDSVSKSISFSLPQPPSSQVISSANASSRRSPAEYFTDGYWDESAVSRHPDYYKWFDLYTEEFSTRSDLCFALFDIDRNGVPELFVNEGYSPSKPSEITFAKLYTVKSGKIVLVDEIKFHWIGYIEIEEGIIFYPEDEEKTIASFARKYSDGKLTEMKNYISTFYDKDGNYMYKLGSRTYERAEDGHIPSVGLYRICFYEFDVEFYRYSLPPHYDR